MGIKIITDSTADFCEEIRSQVTVVPLTLKFGDKEYLDGVDISKEEFFKKLETTDIMPTTSQPSPHAFKEKYEELLKNGDDIIVITISSKLSGTYNSAIIAAEKLQDKVFVIDSKQGSIGEGVLIELALALIKEGRNVREICEILKQQSEKIRIVALLNTLDYLVKGGRLNKGAGLIGKALNLKVILKIQDGEISPMGKARGFSNAKKSLNELIEKEGNIDFEKPYLIGYSGSSSTDVEKYLCESYDIWQERHDKSRIVQIGSVVGTHSGPGAIIAALFAKN